MLLIYHQALQYDFMCNELWCNKHVYIVCCDCESIHKGNVMGVDKGFLWTEVLSVCNEFFFSVAHKNIKHSTLGWS